MIRLVYTCLFLFLSQIAVYSQYDYLLCEQVKLQKEGSKQSISFCSLSEKSLKKTFGKHYSVTKIDLPARYIIMTYPGLILTIDTIDPLPRDLRLETSNFTLLVNDSLVFKVGYPIEKILNFFPNSCAHQNNSENGLSNLVLYLIFDQKFLSDLKSCTTRLIINYNIENKIIQQIHFFILD